MARLFLGLGNGSDGKLTVTTDTEHSCASAGLVGSYTAGDTAITLDESSTFQNNEIVLIIQSRGTNVGKAELNQIKSGAGSTSVTLTHPLENNYTDDAGNSQIQIIEVKQYSSIEFQNGAKLICPYWDGNKNGILPIMVSGRVYGSGTLSAKGRGYRGGTGGLQSSPTGYSYPTDNESSEDAYSGESYSGVGTNNDASSHLANNGGGGGGDGRFDDGQSGGGGGHATAGSDGQTKPAGNGDTTQNGRGGATYGTTDLREEIHFGSGGGGGGGKPGAGGINGTRGGGAVLLWAYSLANTVLIDVSADDGQTTLNNGDLAGEGAGAGGSALIWGVHLDVGANNINVNGGTGGVDHSSVSGGNGGKGRAMTIACKQDGTLTGYSSLMEIEGGLNFCSSATMNM